MKIMHGNQTTGPESSKTTSNIKTGRELCQSKPLVHNHEAWNEHTNQKYTHHTIKSTYQQAETPGTQPELIRANQNKYPGIHRIQSSENYTAITTASRRTMTDTLARKGLNGHEGRVAVQMRRLRKIEIKRSQTRHQMSPPTSPKLLSGKCTGSGNTAAWRTDHPSK